MLRQLTESELSETLNRAREIAAEAGELEAGGELETYVHAAAEVGISGEAMRQALRERAPVLQRPMAEGDTVFAPSADGCWYPAVLLSRGEHTARVKFLSGSEHEAPLRELQALSLIPGRKLAGEIKGWGWYPIRVERFDAEKNQVHYVEDDWAGSKGRMGLQKFRLERKHVYPEEAGAAQAPRGFSRAALYWMGAVGVFGGYVLHHFLPHLLPFLR